MYCVKDLYERHAKWLDLKLIAGKIGLSQPIRVPEAQLPGLCLSGYLDNYSGKGILIFGRTEIGYLLQLDSEIRKERLEAIIYKYTPAIIIARPHRPPKEIATICESLSVPLFRSNLPAMDILIKLIHVLREDFAPTICLHGTLVEAFGVGMLIQGDSAIGKSETALGLIERGHCLVSDDIVNVRRIEGIALEGTGALATPHHMEIRGIGIINVASLYGVKSVKNQNRIDLAIRLEEWKDDFFYDRVGIEEKYITLLDIKIPFHILPVKMGRDLVLLLETIALNHRLKEMGCHSAKEFGSKILRLCNVGKGRKV